MMKSLRMLICMLLFCIVNAVAVEENKFSEELLIRPLPSGHIYSQFEFTTLWSNPSISNSISEYKDYEFVHYDLFPRAFGEIIERYHVRELHLSLTQGLWRHQIWGYPFLEAPPGAQLWVWFNPKDHPLDQTWKDLVNALSGLFCASLNFIDSTNTVSPELSFRPLGVADEWYSRNSSFMRYAALPRENVCTENLTPWKKLLPCDTKCGLASLLYPTPLYSAHYHSLSLHLRPTCQNDDCSNVHLELVQSLSLVQRSLQDMEGRQDWTLRKLFSSPLLSVCPMASSSKVYVDVTGNENSELFSLVPEPNSISSYDSDSQRKSYAEWDLASLASDDSFNLRARYYSRHIFGRIPGPPLQVSRFITGYGQEGGSITVKLTNNGDTSLSVIYLEVLPWYLRLFFHSSHSKFLQNSIRVSKLVTARDRERGWLYEAVVEVPPKSTTELQLQFTRALLKWLEYPPDANHGFYLPSAIFSTILPTTRNVSTNKLEASSLKERLSLTEGASFIRIASEALLVSLPTPDFSMPYNVICLACTVVALAFGPIHNITTKRLVLKKQESRPFFLKKLWLNLKSKLSRGEKGISKKTEEEEKERESNNHGVHVEENPLYEEGNKSELEDILEEVEETEKNVQRKLRKKRKS